MKLKTNKRSRKNRRNSKTRALLKRKRATIRGGGDTSACSREVDRDTGNPYYNENGCQSLIYDEVTTFLNNLYSQFSDEFKSSTDKDAVVRKYEQICAKKRLEVSKKYGKDYKQLMDKELEDKSVQISQIMVELNKIIPKVNGLSDRTKQRLIRTLKLQSNNKVEKPAWRYGGETTTGEEGKTTTGEEGKPPIDAKTVPNNNSGIWYILCVGGVTFAGFCCAAIGAIPAFFIGLAVCAGTVVPVQ